MLEPDSGGVTLLSMASPAPLKFPAPSDMAALLAEVVSGVAGGTKAAWLKRIGEVEQVPTWRHVTHNWHVSPTGSADQREVIERAIQVVRAEHPYVG